MSGFDRSLAPVGLDALEPPPGHTRLREAMQSHLEDLERLGLAPATCDLCGHPHAKPVDRAAVKPSTARWIRLLCEKCERRFLRAERVRG
jgi:hypothetical protein